MASSTLAERFRHFADTECSDEPLYAAICRIVGASGKASFRSGEREASTRIPLSFSTRFGRSA